MGNAQGGGAAPAAGGEGPASTAGCPVKKAAAAPPAPVAGAGCPIKGGKANKSGTVYNVYSQPIDPTNQMPANPNNQPAPGQGAPLSTNRVASQIPKGGTAAETWTYPSPQMFWNALVRKGKAEGANEEDMEVVVAIHNNMNENTWRKVLEWEALHSAQPTPQGTPGEDVDPHLSRFLGRPDDISPKAWIKSLFGHPLPFDRHDWVVQRADGIEVRYVIDYYHDDEAAKENKVPKGLHDVEAVKSISVDVRPALDSVGAAVDRGVRMPVSRVQGKTPFEPLPFFWTGNKVVAEEAKPAPKVPAGSSSSKLVELSVTVQASCASHFAALRACTDEAGCAKAAVGLTYCMGSILCKEEAKAFDTAVNAPGSGDKHEAAIEATFNQMQTCLDAFEKQNARGGVSKPK